MYNLAMFCNLKNLSFTSKLYVARNPSTPVSILEQLSEDENWVVRWHVTCNPSTPVSTLQLLSTDKNEIVRYNAGEKGIERAKLGFEFLTVADKVWIAEQNLIRKNRK